MTKKHFNAMADHFKDILSSCETPAEKAKVVRCVIAFCKVAQQTNPAFDRERFIIACQA